jgi:hypothetical protein
MLTSYPQPFILASVSKELPSSIVPLAKFTGGARDAPAAPVKLPPEDATVASRSGSMATPTSRRAPAAPNVLTERRELCEERIRLEHKLTDDQARVASIEARLKQIATELGDSFKETFPNGDYVSASGAVAAEFKGDVPVIQTEDLHKPARNGCQLRIDRAGLVHVTGPSRRAVFEHAARFLRQVGKDRGPIAITAVVESPSGYWAGSSGRDFWSIAVGAEVFRGDEPITA